MKRTGRTQQGFTMIELIMVIVILGILAAVALPRFYNLQGDAREAKADAILGTLRSASAIAHSAALVNNATGGTGSVTMEGTAVNLVNGYPDVHDTAGSVSSSGIIVAANLDATNDGLTIAQVDGTSLTITIDGAATAANCRITYTEAASGAQPTIALVKTGC